ncbi:MAG: glycosyltransferase, partial [Nitrosopumilales archaeon]
MTPSIEDSSSSKRPYFSVIILFWNSNLFIQNCLDSLNKQTFHDFEVILVNNASPEPFPQDIFSQFPTIT